MIRDPDRLAEFERQDKQEALRNMSYLDALAIFESLWEEARALNPNFGKDWRRDIEPVLAVARAVNGLSPAA
jgi:hypothetical protein